MKKIFLTFCILAALSLPARADNAFQWDSGYKGDAPDAVDIVVDASSFSGLLSSTDTDLQTALETVDASSLSGVTGFGLMIDNAGSAITTGVKGDLTIPYACTINSVTMLADTSTTTTIDIWKDTYANYPADNSDSITASSVPTITATTKSTDATLTGWTTTVTAGDTIRFNVDANDNATRVTILLKCTKT